MYIKRFVNGKICDEKEFKGLNPKNKNAEKLMSGILFRLNEKQSRENHND